MIWVGVFGGLMALLAIAAAIAVGYREAEEEQLELLETRAERLFRLADAADELRAELGREPSVREIYEAAAALNEDGTDDSAADEAAEVPSDVLIDLRRRVAEIVTEGAVGAPGD